MQKKKKKKKVEWICGNDIAKIGGEFFFPSYFDNAIATNPFHFIYLFKKWYVHTIFTTNFKWQVVIMYSNISVKFKFELIITNHLLFVVKML